MRVSALMDAGASRHTIATARECGTLVRVTRGWVALPGADDLLVGAARRGVVLTCVTQAARLGLWVLASGPRPHVSASPHAGRAPTQEAVVHRHRPLVPRHPDHLCRGCDGCACRCAARCGSRGIGWTCSSGTGSSSRSTGRTHTGAQRDEDIAHDATLTLMGYHVIRVSYRHVVDDWASVQDTIMRAAAQGLHRAR